MLVGHRDQQEATLVFSNQSKAPFGSKDFQRKIKGNQNIGKEREWSVWNKGK
jgi:hypothetical protein